ncbi:MAG: gamma-glutamyltransferase, partial [Calditrichaeota bacterium]|nr:gamma-glutamyltransferase [Calditrichota bacterium]
TMKKYNGLLDSTDLKFYQAKERTPVIGTYRGYQIVSSAPPSGGGTFLIELLNIMEGYDVAKIGHNSAQYLHVLSEAMKMIFADKALNSADPDFYRVPVDTFVDKQYARRLRKRILPTKARFDYQPRELALRESNSTSHFSVVDEQGNLVALTQSINHWFGSGMVVEGTGILLNDHLHDFSEKPDSPNAIEPHKRPTSSIAPTIVLKDGKPFMALGTPGGTRIISALAQIIMNVIDFGMSLDDAIEAPRIHCLKKIVHVEGRIDEKVIRQLKKMGHPVKVHADFDNYFGGAQGILLDLNTGTLHGGADSRRDGVAIGY